MSVSGTESFWKNDGRFCSVYRADCRCAPAGRDGTRMQGVRTVTSCKPRASYLRIQESGGETFDSAVASNLARLSNLKTYFLDMDSILAQLIGPCGERINLTKLLNAALMISRLNEQRGNRIFRPQTIRIPVP